jgi:hypothetical protein
MENRIKNDMWIELGTSFCQLKLDFTRKFRNKQKELGNTKSTKYHFSDLFIVIAGNLDSIIQNDYDISICLIDDYSITDIFYNMIEYDYKDDFTNVKSNIELKNDLLVLENKIKDNLKIYKWKDEYKNIFKYIKKINTKLDKNIDN